VDSNSEVLAGIIINNNINIRIIVIVAIIIIIITGELE
jgi:hypothetical protein